MSATRVKNMRSLSVYAVSLVLTLAAAPVDSFAKAAPELQRHARRACRAAVNQKNYGAGGTRILVRMIDNIDSKRR